MSFDEAARRLHETAGIPLEAAESIAERFIEERPDAFERAILEGELLARTDEAEARSRLDSGLIIIDDTIAERRCRRCGCTDTWACIGGCSWVAADLCSACAPTLASQLEDLRAAAAALWAQILETARAWLSRR